MLSKNTNTVTYVNQVALKEDRVFLSLYVT